MKSISYIEGDATAPIGSGNKVIIHICNNLGLWGAGFVLALSKKWKAPEQIYRKCFEHNSLLHTEPIKLGDIQLINVTPDILVVNMIAQYGVRSYKGNPPLRYWALDKCLNTLASRLSNMSKIPSIHCPRIGCGLAGGSWTHVEQLLLKNLSARNFSIFVYDLPEKSTTKKYIK